MKLQHRYRVVISITIVCGGVVAAPSSLSSDTRDFRERQIDDAALHQRLRAIEAAAGAVTDLHADFLQHRHTPLLKRPLISKGTVLAVGDRMRWDTVSPRKSSLLVGPTSVELYYPDDALIEVYPVESGFRDLAGVPMPQLHLLRKRFDIAPMKVHDMDPTADPDRFLAIALTPKAEDLRDHVTSIKMMIDQFRSVATKVFITGPDGDRTEISFSNIQLNTGMDPARVDLSTPEGTRRVSPLGEADPHSAQGAVQ